MTFQEKSEIMNLMSENECVPDRMVIVNLQRLTNLVDSLVRNSTDNGQTMTCFAEDVENLDIFVDQLIKENHD